MKRNHRSLKAWQQAMELVEVVYHVTKRFPKAETFGLTSQMRRAAVSVPSNIAEGAARTGTRELLQFLNIAAASLSELDTQAEIAQRLGYLQDATLTQKIDEVGGILLGLAASIRAKSARK